MSSFLSVYGSLVFPAGALARWQAAPLVLPDEDAPRGDGIFDGANDLGSVREVLTSDAECGVFVRFIVEGDTLHVRAVLADDDWSSWCARIAALATEAARFGARGTLETEDDGSYAGRLVVDQQRTVYVPRSRQQPNGSDHDGRQALARIWAEVIAADKAACEQAARKTAARKFAKPAATKKVGKKAATKQVVTKAATKTAKKAAAKKVAKKITRSGA